MSTRDRRAQIAAELIYPLARSQRSAGGKALVLLAGSAAFVLLEALREARELEQLDHSRPAVREMGWAERTR